MPRAMPRAPSPAATRREISSRSASVNVCSARCRMRGRTRPRDRYVRGDRRMTRAEDGADPQRGLALLPVRPQRLYILRRKYLYRRLTTPPAKTGNPSRCIHRLTPPGLLQNRERPRGGFRAASRHSLATVHSLAKGRASIVLQRSLSLPLRRLPLDQVRQSPSP